MNNSRHFTGAASEHYIAAWFLRHSFKVWWPAVQQGHVDFLVESEEGFQRVQCKTATWNSSAHATSEYLQVRVRPQNNQPYPPDAFEILAATAPDGRIWMIPWKEVSHLKCIHLDKRGISATNQSKRGYKPDVWLCH